MQCSRAMPSTNKLTFHKLRPIHRGGQERPPRRRDLVLQELAHAPDNSRRLGAILPDLCIVPVQPHRQLLVVAELQQGTRRVRQLALVVAAGPAGGCRFEDRGVLLTVGLCGVGGGG